MRIERFDPEVHAEQVRTWCAEWGYPADILDIRPQIGLIVPDVIVGFLFQTDSPVAIMEGIVANPRVGKDQRGRALRLLVLAIVDAATEAGATHLWAHSTRKDLGELGKRLGFRVTGAEYLFGSKRLG